MHQHDSRRCYESTKFVYRLGRLAEDPLWHRPLRRGQAKLWWSTQLDSTRPPSKLFRDLSPNLLLPGEPHRERQTPS